MRVICIKDTVCYSVEGPITLLKKGQIFHVISIHNTDEMRQRYLQQLMETNSKLLPGKWYQFLETDGYHNESHFLELPSDDEITNVIEKYENVQEFK